MSEICTHSAKVHHPLMAIISPIPFATWAIDILGPFPKAMGQQKYLFVIVDYFTKWVKAEAITSITATEVGSSFRRISSLALESLE